MVARARRPVIEEKLAGRPPRPTRPFDEREAALRALPDDELRRALVTERGRASAALWPGATAAPGTGDPGA